MTAFARVQPVEHDLLSLVRALFEPRQHAVVAPLLRTARPLGPAIGRTSMAVLQDTLAKGLVRMLARDLATAREPLPPKPSLHVSEGSFRFLRWLTAKPLGAPTIPPLEDDGAPQTFADQVVVVLAIELARTAAVLQVVIAQSWVQRAPLAWLCSTDDLAQLPVPSTPLDLDALALLPRTLADRLHAIELAKARLASPVARTRIGRAQAALLDPAVATAIAKGRWDALRFLLDGVSRIEPALFSAPLDPQSALSARVEARRAAVAPLRAIVAIGKARARLRLVGFVDDDYEDAQKSVRFLAPWEDLFDRAEAQVRAADNLEDLP